METTKIASAFVKAQKAFSPALKTSINPHFKSRYVGLDGCVEAVIDALNDNGIALMQHTSECENGVIVETIFLHESGETLNCGKLHVPASKMDAQGYGSALTYARRYSLMAACGIAPEDDDGNAASKAKPAPAQSVPKDHWDSLTEPDKRRLQGVADTVRASMEAGDMETVMVALSEVSEVEEKTALWSRLDSKERSAIKKYQQTKEGK